MRNIDLFTSLLTAVVRCAGVILCSDKVFIQKDEFSQYVREILDESERSENEKEENVEVEEELAETVVNPKKSKPKPWEWSSLLGRFLLVEKVE